MLPDDPEPGDQRCPEPLAAHSVCGYCAVFQYVALDSARNNFFDQVFLCHY
jgi:hypothetical protein